MTLKAKSSLTVLSLVGPVLLVGCSIRTNENGDKKDVDIRSPFGSISVHEGNVDAKDIGLPSYPGAHASKKHGDDSDNANVNISGPMGGVKVVVQTFETDDPPAKVLDFYQNPMAKYGKVIQCNGEYHGNYHHHGKDAPVSCDNNSNSSEKELKVGTEEDQHVVAVKPRGSGSEFTLVYVRAKEGKEKDTI